MKRPHAPPWRVYFADSGLLPALLGIRGSDDLLRHPKVGASWEGFVIGTVRRQLGARRDQCHFWALPSGAELDLLVVDGGRRLGLEVKRSDSPGLSPSLRPALVRLARLYRAAGCA